MAGRIPKLNWTPSLNQFTVTLNKRLHRLGRNRVQAEKKFQWLLRQHGHGAQTDSNPTYAEVADAWLGHVKEHHSAHRYHCCKVVLEDFINYVGEKRRVNSLLPEQVEQWIAAHPTWAASATRSLNKGIVIAALNWAAHKKVQLIPVNPLRGTITFEPGKSRGGGVVWTPEIFHLVLSVLPKEYQDFLKLIAWTGARPSVIRRVEARHYRPELKLWDVADVCANQPSSKKKTRRVWLPPQAVALVEELNRERPVGPICVGPLGAAMQVRKSWLVLELARSRLRTKNIELPEELCVYGLRHTFATNFIKEHPDKLEYLRELMGHRDLTMIRRTYSHLFDEHAALHEVLDNFTGLGTGDGTRKASEAPAALSSPEPGSSACTPPEPGR